MDAAEHRNHFIIPLHDAAHLMACQRSFVRSMMYIPLTINESLKIKVQLHHREAAVLCGIQDAGEIRTFFVTETFSDFGSSQAGGQYVLSNVFFKDVHVFGGQKLNLGPHALIHEHGQHPPHRCEDHRDVHKKHARHEFLHHQHYISLHLPKITSGVCKSALFPPVLRPLSLELLAGTETPFAFAMVCYVAHAR